MQIIYLILQKRAIHILLPLCLLLAGCETTPTPTPTATSTAHSFVYLVRLIDANDAAISGLAVQIEIEGKAALSEITDNNGYARIAVPGGHAGQRGRIVIPPSEYKHTTRR